LSEPFNTDNPRELRHVTRRTEPDLPQHVLSEVCWTEIHGHPRYYVQNVVTWEWHPVEFVDNHWYWLFLSEGQFYTALEDRIEPNTQGTGYWDITDPQHPYYVLEPVAPTSTSSAGLHILTQPLVAPLSEPTVSSPYATARTDTPALGSRLQTRSPSPETSPEDEKPSSDSPETLAPTAAPSARLSPQDQSILAAQF
jgi:hypothetical protein